MASLLGESLAGGTLNQGAGILPHHTPRARSVIFLYMDGGPAQMDTFDPKPRLQKDHGTPFPMQIEATQFDNKIYFLSYRKAHWTNKTNSSSNLRV